MKCALFAVAFFVALTARAQTPAAPADTSFLGSFPHLKTYVYEEPKSGFYLGAGVSPVGILKDRLMVTLNFFQLHWIKDRWDIEVLNASYGFTRAQSTAVQSSNFTLRMAPKYRVAGVFSVGPLFGYEFVSFPNISAELFKAPYSTPSEPFSSRGVIYGAMMSQTIPIGKDYLLQINELFYQQTYSTEKTPEGWRYIYDNPDIRKDPKLIQASSVLMIEASFLF